MLRINHGFFRVLCSLSAAACLALTLTDACAQESASGTAPEVEINRSVLDDLDGYTPPPLFDSPERPVLSRPLKTIPLPALTGPSAESAEDSGRALSPGEIEEHKRRGLAHPIIEDTPPRKVTRMTTGNKLKDGGSAKKPSGTNGIASDPTQESDLPPAPAAAPVKAPPLPARKPRLAAAVQSAVEPIRTQTETQAEASATAPPAPSKAPLPPPIKSPVPPASAKPSAKDVPPVPPAHLATMPALPPVKVEQENLRRDTAPAVAATQKLPAGDITAYDPQTLPPPGVMGAWGDDISSARAPTVPGDAPERTSKEDPVAVAAPPPLKTASLPLTQDDAKPESVAPVVKTLKTERSTGPEGGAGRTRIDFAKGKSDLDPGQSDILATKVLSALKGEENPRRVQIQAYATASDQGQSSARRVSLLRALSIRAWLVGQGVDPRKIDVRALGDQGTGEGSADRVDLVIFDPQNPP